MNEPSELHLPQGIDEEKLTAAVVTSGYPLQTVVALTLSKDFTVVEEWGYVDRASGEHRALDLFAHRPFPGDAGAQVHPSVSLLIECKQSSLPYVLFGSAIQRLPAAFPAVIGVSRRHFRHQVATSYREVEPAEFFRSIDYPFVFDGPPLVASLSRAERRGKGFELSGETPYRNTVLPLVSALQGLRESRSRSISAGDHVFPAITVCIAVIDAPLVLARGTPESPELSTISWARVVRQEVAVDHGKWERRHYAIDVVTRPFLQEFIDGHLIPFAEGLAARMTGAQAVTISGLLDLPEWHSWYWSEVANQG